MFKVLIEGCRAVGKTTLCNNLIEQGVVSFYRERFELKPEFQQPRSSIDFNYQQQYYINREIDIWPSLNAPANGIALVIASPETLDFYTRNYSKAYSTDWSLDSITLKMLEKLSYYRCDLIIYLAANDNTIINRMKEDTKQRPTFWDYYYRWQKLNKEYYNSYNNVVTIDTTNLSINDVCASAMKVLHTQGAI